MAPQRNNKPAQALEEIEHLAADDPQNAVLRNLEAIVCGHLGEYETAIALFAGLLEEYPERAALRLSFGHVLRFDARRADPLAHFDACCGGGCSA